MAFVRALSSVLGLATCLCATDPTLLNLAMPDARAAAGINLDQAKATRLGQHLLANMLQHEDQDFQKFVAATGFDPRRDLSEILLVSPGGKRDRKLVIARGAFNKDSLEAAAIAHGANRTSYRGMDILSDPHNADHGAFAILNATLAVAGDPDSVRQAVDRNAKPGGTALDPTLAAEISRVSGLYDAWFVSVVPLSELTAHVPDQAMNGPLNGDALKSVKQASGGVSLREDPVKFAAEFVSASAQDANSLAGALQFLAGLARMGQQQPPPAFLNSVINTLSVTTTGSKVSVAFAISEKDLESAPGQRQHRRRVAPASQRPVQ